MLWERGVEGCKRIRGFCAVCIRMLHRSHGPSSARHVVRVASDLSSCIPPSALNRDSLHSLQAMPSRSDGKRKAWTTPEMRGNVSKKLPTTRDQDVDHRLEIQTVIDAMNRVGASKDTAAHLKKIINDRDTNLRVVSRAENRRTGNEINHYRQTREAGDVPSQRAIEKQLEGLHRIKKDANNLMQSDTRAVIKDAERDLKSQLRR